MTSAELKDAIYEEKKQKNRLREEIHSMRAEMEIMARATQEWEKNKGANAYKDELPAAKKTSSSAKFSNRP